MTVLSTSQLHKTYGNITAVNQLSLEVEAGNIYGILGPNGSGKTTTLGMVLGIIQPDGGTFQWFEGKYGNNHRRHLGALLETPNFYPYLSALKNLEIVAEIKKVKNPDLLPILDMVGLLERAKYKFSGYSLGMKQRLAIAAAMVGDPDVLIFDEPANGLDPQGIAEIRHTIQRIGEMGKTIIMSSHILDEVEKVCTHVCIIKNGNLLATGPIGAILSNDVLIEVNADNVEALRTLFGEKRFVRQMQDIETGGLLLTVDEEIQPRQLNRMAFDSGIELSHLRERKLSLEEEFLEITK